MLFRSDASALPVGVRFTAVATGGFVTCATASDGTAWCWGQSDWGQLGGARGDAECFGWRCQTLPARTLVLEPRTVTAVSVGVTHACALAADGTILCWGTDTDGQLGDGPSR